MKDSNFFFKTTLFDLRVSFIFFFIQNIVGRARTKAPASHGARVWVWFRARVGWGSRFAEGRIQKDKGVRQCFSKKRCSISKKPFLGKTLLYTFSKSTASIYPSPKPNPNRARSLLFQQCSEWRKRSTELMKNQRNMVSSTEQFSNERSTDE